MFKLNINEFSKGWIKFIDGRLSDKDMTARELARLVGCNEGQISHCRKGHIPRRPMVEKIGRILGEEATLRAAGFLPSSAGVA